MTGATYELTTPAQLELHRQERARAAETLARSIERMRQLSQSMRGQTPSPANRSAS